MGMRRCLRLRLPLTSAQSRADATALDWMSRWRSSAKLRLVAAKTKRLADAVQVNGTRTAGLATTAVAAGLERAAVFLRAAARFATTAVAAAFLRAAGLERAAGFAATAAAAARFATTAARFERLH